MNSTLSDTRNRDRSCAADPVPDTTPFFQYHCSSLMLSGYGRQLRLKRAGTAADRRPSPSPHFDEEPEIMARYYA